LCSRHAGGYATSVLKDAFSVPRPYSPPVVRLSVGSHALEYGFPSTHSSNACSMALFAGETLLSKFELEVVGKAVAFAGLAVFAWSVVFGRLYTGMVRLGFRLLRGLDVCVPPSSCSLVLNPDTALDDGRRRRVDHRRARLARALLPRRHNQRRGARLTLARHARHRPVVALPRHCPPGGAAPLFLSPDRPHEPRR